MTNLTNLERQMIVKSLKDFKEYNRDLYGVAFAREIDNLIKKVEDNK